jgi:hypothetical protein
MKEKQPLPINKENHRANKRRYTGFYHGDFYRDGQRQPKAKENKERVKEVVVFTGRSLLFRNE